MRLNYNYTAVAPTTRNEFIHSVIEKKEAIVVNHDLLQELTKEINSQISTQKTGSFFKKAAVPMALLSWNPVGWALSGITLLCGIFTGAASDLKKYVIYAGCDTTDNQIIVLHNKRKVDLSHDKVIYPEFVKSVDYKKTDKKIKPAK